MAYLTQTEKAILDRLLRLAEDSDYFSSTENMPGHTKTDEDVTREISKIRTKLQIPYYSKEYPKG